MEITETTKSKLENKHMSGNLKECNDSSKCNRIRDKLFTVTLYNADSNRLFPKHHHEDQRQNEGRKSKHELFTEKNNKDKRERMIRGSTGHGKDADVKQKINEGNKPSENYLPNKDKSTFVKLKPMKSSPRKNIQVDKLLEKNRRAIFEDKNLKAAASVKCKGNEKRYKSRPEVDLPDLSGDFEVKTYWIHPKHKKLKNYTGEKKAFEVFEVAVDKKTNKKDEYLEKYSTPKLHQKMVTTKRESTSSGNAILDVTHNLNKDSRIPRSKKKTVSEELEEKNHVENDSRCSRNRYENSTVGSSHNSENLSLNDEDNEEIICYPLIIAPLNSEKTESLDEGRNFCEIEKNCVNNQGSCVKRVAFTTDVEGRMNDSNIKQAKRSRSEPKEKTLKELFVAKRYSGIYPEKIDNLNCTAMYRNPFTECQKCKDEPKKYLKMGLRRRLILNKSNSADSRRKAELDELQKRLRDKAQLKLNLYKELKRSERMNRKRYRDSGSGSKGAGDENDSQRLLKKDELLMMDSQQSLNEIKTIESQMKKRAEEHRSQNEQLWPNPYTNNISPLTARSSGDERPKSRSPLNKFKNILKGFIPDERIIDLKNNSIVEEHKTKSEKSITVQKETPSREYTLESNLLFGKGSIASYSKDEWGYHYKNSELETLMMKLTGALRENQEPMRNSKPISLESSEDIFDDSMSYYPSSCSLMRFGRKDEIKMISSSIEDPDERLTMTERARKISSVSLRYKSEKLSIRERERNRQKKWQRNRRLIHPFIVLPVTEDIHHKKQRTFLQKMENDEVIGKGMGKIQKMNFTFENEEDTEFEQKLSSRDKETMKGWSGPSKKPKRKPTASKASELFQASSSISVSSSETEYTSERSSNFQTDETDVTSSSSASSNLTSSLLKSTTRSSVRSSNDGKNIYDKVLKIENDIKEIQARIKSYPSSSSSCKSDLIQMPFHECFTALKEKSKSILKHLKPPKFHFPRGCQCHQPRGYNSEPEPDNAVLKRDEQMVRISHNLSDIDLNVAMELIMENFDPVTGKKLPPENDHSCEQEGNIKCNIITADGKPLTFIDTDFYYNPKTGMIFKGAKGPGNLTQISEISVPLNRTNTYLLPNESSPGDKSTEPENDKRKKFKRSTDSRENDGKNRKIDDDSKENVAKIKIHRSSQTKMNQSNEDIPEDKSKVYHLSEEEVHQMTETRMEKESPTRKIKSEIEPKKSINSENQTISRALQETTKHLNLKEVKEIFSLERISMEDISSEKIPKEVFPCEESISPRISSEVGNCLFSSSLQSNISPHGFPRDNLSNGKMNGRKVTEQNQALSLKDSIKDRSRINLSDPSILDVKYPRKIEITRMDVAIQTELKFFAPTLKPVESKPSRIRPPKKVCLNVGCQVDLAKEDNLKYVRDIKLQKKVNLAIAELCFHLSQNKENKREDGDDEEVEGDNEGRD